MEKAREVVREIIEMRSILIGNKKSPTILEQKDRPNNTEFSHIYNIHYFK